MHRGYRNCYYSYKEGLIYLRTWDDDGNRVVKKHVHNPYLYVKTSEHTKHVSIFGDYLKKIEFNNVKEKNIFVDTTAVELFYNLPIEQQFLLDHYIDTKFEDMIQEPLKTVYLDIECPSGTFSPDHKVKIKKLDDIMSITVGDLDQYLNYDVWDEIDQLWRSISTSCYKTKTGGFPDPEQADHPINAIGCWDTSVNKYIVFGIGYYNVYSVVDYCKGIDPLDIDYINCKDEKDLFKKFIRWWRSDFPDVIVSWNGFSFDLPYIVHRMNRLFGDEKARCLSPYDYYSYKEKESKFGSVYKEYNIAGVAHIDYMVLYKTLKPEMNLDSFSLDFVANEELNDVAKLDLEGMSLWDLSIKNFNKYISYNIQDVNVMRLLDNKLKLLDMARFLCTMGYCGLDKVYGKVGFIQGMFARRSLEKGKIMLTRRPPKEVERIEGGFVREPRVGLTEDVIYFDANSLYPNTIITLNISPETKRGKVTQHGSDFYIKTDNVDEKMTRQELVDFVKKQNYTLTGSGHLFSKDHVGVLPEFCDYLYQKRQQHKKKMLLAETEKNKYRGTSEYDKWYIEEGYQNLVQNVYKTVMNSCYGVMLNKYFPLFDRDCGQSITLSGQKIIKKSFDIFNNYLQKATGLDKDFVVCGDTDSVAIEVKDLLQMRNINIYGEDGFVNDNCNALDQELSDVLNNNIRSWVEKTYFASDIRYEFKRETICKNALFMMKKNYCLNIIDKEGVKVKKMIMKGNLNKGVCSKTIKDMGKRIVKGILLEDWKEKDAIDYFHEIVLEKLPHLTVSELAKRENCKTFNKYSKINGLKYISGTPGHVKGALNYNFLIDTLNLGNQYRKVVNGTKVQTVQVKDNKYGIGTIGYIDQFPSEFNLEIDREATAQKTLESYIKPIFLAMGWNEPDVKTLYAFNLNDLF